MRSHGLVQSTPILAQVIEKTPIKRDVSLFLPYHPNLKPINYWWKNQKLLRIPYFWEDDVEMQQPKSIWHKNPLLFQQGKGLKIFNFHPVHIYLNSNNMETYEIFKRSVGNLTTSTPSEAKDFINSGEGAGNYFSELVEGIPSSIELLCIRDINKEIAE